MSGGPVSQFGHYMRISERVRASINIAVFLADQCKGLTDLDPEIAPEVVTALEHVGETMEALGRAEAFAATRLEVMIGGG